MSAAGEARGSNCVLASTRKPSPSRVPKKLQAPERPDHHGGTVTWIVEMPIVWIFPGGERVSGQIAIGVPELVPDGNREAICPITMGGLDGQDRVTHIHGEGTLHALMLALGYIERRIRDSVAQGVRVELPDYRDDPEHPDRDTEFLVGLFDRLHERPPNESADSDPAGV